MVNQKVVNVKFFGGIMVLFNSPRKRMERVIKEENEKGYGVVFILPGSFTILFTFFSLIILLFTLFLWQPLPGYMVVFNEERKDYGKSKYSNLSLLS